MYHVRFLIELKKETYIDKKGDQNERVTVVKAERLK
jgi:hypothetical protein